MSGSMEQKSRVSLQLELPFETSLPKVTLKMSFEDMLGKTKAEMPDDVRRQRWENWKKLAAKSKRSREILSIWQDTEACTGCDHLCGDWCNSMELPATVNPILSFRVGMPGMACMGFGHTHDPEDAA